MRWEKFLRQNKEGTLHRKTSVQPLRSLLQITGPEGVPLFEIIDLQVAELAMLHLPTNLSPEQNRLALLLFACCHLQTRSGSILFQTSQVNDILKGTSHIVPCRIEIENLYVRMDAAFHNHAANPIFWESAERLYLRKHLQIESRTAVEMVRRARAEVSLALRDDHQTGFEFPKHMTPLQISAATAPLHHRLVFISGGPGTGKTFTIFQSIRFLLHHHPKAVIRLLAPTGKAVARLQESIRRGLQEHSSGSNEAVTKVESSTIHRFLRDRESDRSRYHSYPRPVEKVDYVLVDEASMVDLPLLQRLLASLEADTGLILIGDIHQLASVQPGAAFADTFEVFRQHSPQVPTLELTKNFRFEDSPKLAALCESIRKGDARLCLQLLQNTVEIDEIQLVDSTDSHRIDALLRQWVKARVIAAVHMEDPSEALDYYGQSMILCAQNEGPFGVNSMNRSILRACDHAYYLHRSGTHDHYYWKPVIVRKNDYTLKLFNGDVGVLQHTTLPNPTQSRLACFRSPEGDLVTHADHLLPEVSDAFAYTVHKSQGSEANHVLLILPEQANPLLSRELLYTAVSRARKTLTLVATPTILQHCVEHPTIRGSYLGARILHQLERERF